MLAGISTEAARMIDPNYTVTATSNMFFMIVSTFLITLLGWFITDKIVEPRLGKYKGVSNLSKEDDDLRNLSDKEAKALKITNLVVLLMIVAIIVATLMPESLLRNLEVEKTSGFVSSIINNSPLMNGFVPIMAIIFFVAAIVYGRVSGQFKNHKDVCDEMSKAMSSMGGYIALAFVMAQFVQYFSYTNLAHNACNRRGKSTRGYEYELYSFNDSICVIYRIYKFIYGISFSKVGYNGSSIFTNVYEIRNISRINSSCI